MCESIACADNLEKKEHALPVITTLTAKETNQNRQGVAPKSPYGTHQLVDQD